MSPYRTTVTLPTTAARSALNDGSDLWRFFAFSHGWTWAFWGAALKLNTNVWESSWALGLFAVGGLGLPLGGLAMTLHLAGRSGLRDLWRCLIDPNRLSAGWGPLPEEIGGRGYLLDRRRPPSGVILLRAPLGQRSRAALSTPIERGSSPDSGAVSAV